MKLNKFLYFFGLFLAIGSLLIGMMFQFWVLSAFGVGGLIGMILYGEENKQ